MSLSATQYFHARPILRNFEIKKSAFVDNTRNFLQILCLVGENNEIIIRYRNSGSIPHISLLFDDDDDEDELGDKTTPMNESRRTVNPGLFNNANMRRIVWFRKAGKNIQDICFDPTGRYLLVICYDNTLHIVPILWVINPGLRTTTSQEIETFYWPFRSDEITSFIVPFSGPHECSNSKTCPNNTNVGDNVQATADNRNSDKYTPTQINEMVLANNAYQSFYLQSNQPGCSFESNVIDSVSAKNNKLNMDESGLDSCDKCPSSEQCDTQDQDESIERNCPYPLSVMWWSPAKLVEHSHQHRAIIGYSDGSICVVGLAPNCPFIANTLIDRKSGGIIRMIICRETTINNVSLLVRKTSFLMSSTIWH